MKGTKKECCGTQRTATEGRKGLGQEEKMCYWSTVRAGGMNEGTCSQYCSHGRMQSLMELMAQGRKKMGKK